MAQASMNEKTERRVTNANTASAMSAAQKMRRWATSDAGILILVAVARIAIQTAFNWRYGWHRDELATLDDAKHLAWGYVVYPPLTPFICRVSITLFGPSLVMLRLFALLAQGAGMVLTGLMARELGAKRFWQVMAAIAAAIAPASLASGTMFEYVSFDYVWWVLIAYFMVRLLKSDDARWWLAVGAAIGLGAMTKYTMAFYVAGIVGAVLLTSARRYLRSPWLWCGIAISILIFLPNLIWQVHHNFISLDFLKFIHARDVRAGRTSGYLLHQLWVGANPVTLPIWLAGLYYFFFVPDGKRYRAIGWMYVITLVLFAIAKGRDYYVSPAYPMLLAGGAAWISQWLATQPEPRAITVRSTTWHSLAISGVCVAALVMPIPSPRSRWFAIADKVNGGNFNEQFGWHEMIAEIARVRDSLPAQDRAHLGILTGDAGQAGAVNMWGPAYGLPNAISGSNSNWLRGYGNPPPETLITVGIKKQELDRVFESVEWAGHFESRYGVVNSAVGSEREDVFVCRGPREPWPKFWWSHHWYG
jgi:Dolichyl-phosphate-mannose-protein mannosyltransferase